VSISTLSPHFVFKTECHIYIETHPSTYFDPKDVGGGIYIEYTDNSKSVTTKEQNHNQKKD
jgi:hypothetical protein